MQNKNKINKTIFCFAYQEDLDQAFSFYCARYKDIKYNEFLNLGLFEFKKKLNSIPESEPLYKIIKSRSIKLNTIKNKEERNYWRQLKKINAIPSIYLSNKELNLELNNKLRESRGLK